MLVTPNSSGSAGRYIERQRRRGSIARERERARERQQGPWARPPFERVLPLSSQTIYSGTNRITNFNCKIDFVQLLRRLRPYAPSTPPARSELRLVRGFTKLSLRRRRRRTVSALERETHLAGDFLSSLRADIKSRDSSFRQNGSSEVRAVRNNERRHISRNSSYVVLSRSTRRSP